MLPLAITERSAHAYVRGTADDGAKTSWRARFYRPRLPATDVPEVSSAELRRAMERAAATWNASLARCGDRAVAIDETTDPPSAVPRDVAYDGRDAVVWRTRADCVGAAPSDERCVAGRAARTTVFFRNAPGEDADGEIVEADLELDADNVHFADDGRPGALDLESVLLHEMGHALGLEHTCMVTTSATDDTGRAIPACEPPDALAGAIRATVMFPYLDPGERKRALSGDEARAACDLYGATAASEDSAHASCAEGRTSPTSSTWLWSATALVIAVALRRRKARGATLATTAILFVAAGIAPHGVAHADADTATSPANHAADALTAIAGEVTEIRGRWENGRIVSDVTIVSVDGGLAHATLAGGVVGAIGMRRSDVPWVRVGERGGFGLRAVGSAWWLVERW